MDKLIYQKMAAILRDTKAIGKNCRNQQQNFNFRGIDDVMNEMHDLFAKNGVIVIPEVVDFTVMPETTARGGKLFYTRARIKHHFTAEDGSEVTTTTVGEAMDSGDKGMNKAMSIALKYAILQLFMIPTAEPKDPDGQSYEVMSNPQPQPVPEAILLEAMTGVENAQTKERLQEIWNFYKASYPQLGAKGSELYNAVAAKLAAFKAQEQAI
ncbi:MAG: ERF family protein [Bacteroidales bacterium]|nr:ERF family protein [Bacteroidales bacterium]